MQPRVKGLALRLGLAALLALSPKCLLCGLAYAGLFGLGGAELCGGTPVTWPGWLFVASGAAALAAFFWPNRRRLLDS